MTVNVHEVPEGDALRQSVPNVTRLFLFLWYSLTLSFLGQRNLPVPCWLGGDDDEAAGLEQSPYVRNCEW